MSSTGLIAIGTVAGGMTLNPAVLGSISGAGLALKTFSEIINVKLRWVSLPIQLSRKCC